MLISARNAMIREIAGLSWSLPRSMSGVGLHEPMRNRAAEKGLTRRISSVQRFLMPVLPANFLGRNDTHGYVYKTFSSVR